MDSKILAAVRYLLGVFILILLLVPHSVNAQLGACPANSYLLGEIDGYYPSDLSACVYDLSWQRVVYNSNIHPCGMAVATHDNDSGWGLPVVIVPDASQYYGQLLHYRFIVYGIDPVMSVFPPGYNFSGNGDMRVSYCDSSDHCNSLFTTDLALYDTVYTYSSTTPQYYYIAYFVDGLLHASEGSGGYLHVQFDWDTRTAMPYEWMIASAQLGSNSDLLPAHCPVPNANNPGTPVPVTPTGTLPATWTPHATPSPITTPGATAAGVTPGATATVTPWLFPTLQAEHTPTPWPQYALPTVAWPTMPPVVVAAAVTAESQGGAIATQIAGLQSTWENSTDFASSSMSTTLTTTTGISSPVSIMSDISTGIGLPISYAKTIPDLMPNTSPFILTIIILAAWVVFNLIAKFSIQVVVFVWRLILSLKEIIPFFG